MFEMIEFSWF